MDKSNIMMSLYFCWFLMAVSGIFLFKSYVAIKAYIETKRLRTVYPSIEIAHKETICKGPHTWKETKLALHPLAAGVYQVCSDCGFVAGEKNVKLNGPALEVFKNNLIRRDRLNQQWEESLKRKQEGLKRIMNLMIKSHVGLLGPDLQPNIEVLQQFFTKSTLEIESLFAKLEQELRDQENRG